MGPISASQVMHDLEDRGFVRSYGLLTSYQSNIQIREHVILEARKKWDQTLDKIVRSQIIEPDLIRRLHVEQLECLMHICMYIEDLAYLIYLLRHHPRSMDRPIYFGGSERAQIIKALSETSRRTLSARFRMPKYSKLRLPNSDLLIVKDVFNRYLVGLQHDISMIVNFSNRRYFAVYNEYKHTFDILTGMYSVKDHTLDTHIYVRVTKRKKGKEQEHAFILEASPEAVNYYYKVFDSTSNLINCLTQNTLNYMVYADGRYLIRTPREYSLPQDLLTEYEALIDRHGLHYSKAHSLKLGISLQSKALASTQKQLKEGFIAVLPKPLFSRQFTTTRSSLKVT